MYRVCVSGAIKQLSVTEKACSRLQVLGAFDLGGFDGSTYNQVFTLMCRLDIVQTAAVVEPVQCFWFPSLILALAP